MFWNPLQEMAKKKEVRPKAKASPEGPLKKLLTRNKGGAVRGSPKKKEADEEISRTQRSGFLSYIKAAMKSKCDQTSSQAETINRYYAGLGGEEKKAMISEFFRNGGKRSGLSSVFEQTLNISSKAKSGSWSGYCTFGQLMKLHEVGEFAILMLPIQPTKKTPKQKRHIKAHD